MPRTTIVAIHELEDGGLQIIDAAGGEHRARTGAQAWILLKQILANPDLPEVETPSAQEVQVEDVAVELLESQMPPGLKQFARPAITGILDGLRNISRKNPTR